MSIATKKLKNGFEIPVYGLGTWRMGGGTTQDPSNDDAADIRAIETAIDLGITHIDSAEKYAGGYAETLIGKVVRSQERERMFLATKFSSNHAGAGDVRISVEASLRRLGVEYVDLYMLHSYSSVIPLEETVGAMDALVDEGLVRAIGVSNFGSANLARACAAATHPIVVNQVHYNLAVREVEADGLLAYCQTNDVMVMAWRPVQFDGLNENESPLLDELCERYEKTRQQIALNWLVSQDNVVTISKTRSIEHLQENIGALEFALDSDDIERLRALFPGQRRISDVVALDH